LPGFLLIDGFGLVRIFTALNSLLIIYIASLCCLDRFLLLLSWYCFAYFISINYTAQKWTNHY